MSRDLVKNIVLFGYFKTKPPYTVNSNSGYFKHEGLGVRLSGDSVWITITRNFAEHLFETHLQKRVIELLNRLFYPGITTGLSLQVCNLHLHIKLKCKTSNILPKLLWDFHVKFNIDQLFVRSETETEKSGPGTKIENIDSYLCDPPQGLLGCFLSVVAKKRVPLTLRDVTVKIVPGKNGISHATAIFPHGTSKTELKIATFLRKRSMKPPPKHHKYVFSRFQIQGAFAKYAVNSKITFPTFYAAVSRRLGLPGNDIGDHTFASYCHEFILETLYKKDKKHKVQLDEFKEVFNFFSVIADELKCQLRIAELGVPQSGGNYRALYHPPKLNALPFCLLTIVLEQKSGAPVVRVQFLADDQTEPIPIGNIDSSQAQDTNDVAHSSKDIQHVYSANVVQPNNNNNNNNNSVQPTTSSNNSHEETRREKTPKTSTNKNTEHTTPIDSVTGLAMSSPSREFTTTTSAPTEHIEMMMDEDDEDEGNDEENDENDDEENDEEGSGEEEEEEEESSMDEDEKFDKTDKRKEIQEKIKIMIKENKKGNDLIKLFKEEFDNYATKHEKQVCKHTFNYWINKIKSNEMKELRRIFADLHELSTDKDGFYLVDSDKTDSLKEFVFQNTNATQIRDSMYEATAIIQATLVNLAIMCEKMLHQMEDFLYRGLFVCKLCPLHCFSGKNSEKGLIRITNQGRKKVGAMPLLKRLESSKPLKQETKKTKMNKKKNSPVSKPKKATKTQDISKLLQNPELIKQLLSIVQQQEHHRQNSEQSGSTSTTDEYEEDDEETKRKRKLKKKKKKGKKQKNGNNR